MPGTDFAAPPRGRLDWRIAEVRAIVEETARVRSLLLANCDTEVDSPPPAMLPVIELAKQGKFAQEWLAPWLARPSTWRILDLLVAVMMFTVAGQLILAL